MKTLNRFLEAQDKNYSDALSEITNGKKTTHWMWYVFPQLAGLGHSEMAKFYAIENLREAEDYLNHPVLGKRLTEIATALLKHSDKTAHQILGAPDDVKLQSSMTLFSRLPHTNPVFEQIINQFYNGEADSKTIELSK